MSKRRWSSRLGPGDARLGFRGWHERGYLPHRDEPGLTQFVTFRVADSLPLSLRSEWAAVLEIEDDVERRQRLEDYLDEGRETCSLRCPVVAEEVERALRHLHGKADDLRAWTVMPNHVHVQFLTRDVPMSEIVKAWKSCTARQANRVLGRQGQFWAEDYWDVYRRNTAHELRVRDYIEANPVKAGLVQDPRKWPWSSARLRNAYGVLTI